jgi:putative membrane-bound dehydrogenase-like protein
MSIRPNGKRNSRFVAALLPLCGLAACVDTATAHAAEPRVLADGYKLQLIAKEPDVVTPISMAFDGKGRLLVIESHTHQRPDNYEGPQGDRLRMLTDGDGRPDRWSTFAEGYQQAMNLCVRPDGAVYLVTRRDVRLLRDTDDDGVADQEQLLIKLETEDQYPHNGLSGIVFDPKSDGGVLYLGFGENHGFAYKFTGSDGLEYVDRGGAGLIFRCGADGEKLERYATGFWNPFSLCLAQGRLFCVDNDPDASPPCRLIDVVRGGDYGHRYEYNRAGTHPLQAWNGELPGTLPMVCGTGEAPTAIVSHRGYLWVTSWGDHRIERYELTPRGASFAANLKTVVQGDADFRPTGLAVAPDGSLYFADWVDRSYPVHGKGRIWRLTVPESYSETPPGRSKSSSDFADPFARHRIVDGLLEQSPSTALEVFKDEKPVLRLCALQAIRFRDFNKDASKDELLRKALADADFDVRLYAVRWIADERIMALRDDVARLLDGEMPTERYFLALLAALDWLDGDTEMRSAGISNELLIKELENDTRSPQLHALALQLISPGHKWLTVDRLRSYLKSEFLAVRREAVQTLAMRNKRDRWPLLAEIAAEVREETPLRADAIAGLAEASGEYLDLLEKLAADDDAIIAREAIRVLRLTAHRPPPAEEAPDAADLVAWNKLLAERGDAESGRRLFFTGSGARCAACHQHSGRGGRIGPELTRIGRQQSRERIIASILQPSREIAPEFQPWTLITSDGIAHAGLRLPKGGDDGKERYADANGKKFVLLSEDIELREPSEKSIMPDGLERTLTIADLRDIIAFLARNE